MNTNPNAMTVLCYGDSNTYGQKPDKQNRYAADIRWTGCLQNLLGDKYYVIEEGLGGRATDVEHPKRPGRNGKTYLVPCLASHWPLDVVVLMLGTNDLKNEYQRTADDIAKALEGLVADIKEFSKNSDGQSAKIILVSPAHLNDRALRFLELYTEYYAGDPVGRSQKLAATIRLVAERQGCVFLDAADFAQTGEDGVHWDETSHASFAQEVEKLVRQLA